MIDDSLMSDLNESDAAHNICLVQRTLCHTLMLSAPPGRYLLARCHIELSMSRALQGYYSSLPYHQLQYGSRYAAIFCAAQNKSTRIEYGHLEDKAKYLGMPHPTSGTAFLTPLHPLLFPFLTPAHPNPSGRFPALISHTQDPRRTPRKIAAEADHPKLEPQSWRSQSRPMQCGSTITSIIIDSMRKSLVASSLKNGEKATDTMSRHVVVMRLHASASTLTWRSARATSLDSGCHEPLIKLVSFNSLRETRLLILILLGSLLG